MLFPSVVVQDGVVEEVPDVDWKATCEVKDLRISYLETQLADVTKDRDLYRDKCLGFIFPTIPTVGGTTTSDVGPVPVQKRKTLGSMQRELEMRDRLEAVDLEKKMKEGVK